MTAINWVWVWGQWAKKGAGDYIPAKWKNDLMELIEIELEYKRHPKKIDSLVHWMLDHSLSREETVKEIGDFFGGQGRWAENRRERDLNPRAR